MYRLLRAFLFLLPPELAHAIGMWCLELLGTFGALSRSLRARLHPSPRLAIHVAGLRFEHPVALAAGLDKDAVAVTGLFALGFGGVEVGTTTPRPQSGNPRPRLFRLPEAKALINRMGFNNHGAQVAAQRLQALRWRPGPIGVNVGKNKDTPLEEALADYQRATELLAPHADYVVVNTSSPNTPGLRTLQEPDKLMALLRGVQETLARVTPRRPLFLKIAPDLAPEAIDAVVDVAIACGLAGLIATNTTLERPFSHPRASESGGLSGAPLRELSIRVLRRAYQRAQGKLALIGAGGIQSAQDVYERIRAGASVVQVYTGFIYEGPGMVRHLVRELDQLLAADGLAHVADAVGRDA